MSKLTYPQAVERLTADIRTEVVSALAEMIAKHHAPNSATADGLCRIVDAFQVECKELCAQGLDWQDACRFAYQFGVDRERWLDDDLYPTFEVSKRVDQEDR